MLLSRFSTTASVMRSTRAAWGSRSLAATLVVPCRRCAYHTSSVDRTTATDPPVVARRPPDDAPTARQRIVIAIGGNALQRRGEALSVENMLRAAVDMAPAITRMARDHEVVLTHGNGPQVGALALERTTATLDVLGAESMGQIGYVLAQALAGAGCTAVPILTQVVVDASSPAFQHPTKFVGPIYTKEEADALAKSRGWTVKPDGQHYRRVVPSPAPLEIRQLDAVRLLLEHRGDAPLLPIACGGGGLPVSDDDGRGVEAVIDKDACGRLLATGLRADGYVILTDGGGIWENYGTPHAREMSRVTPDYLRSTKAGDDFPGSMGPKIQAAVDFVTHGSSRNNHGTTAWAAIGDLQDASKILTGEEGTLVTTNVTAPGGVVWRQRS